MYYIPKLNIHRENQTVSDESMKLLFIFMCSNNNNNMD